MLTDSRLMQRVWMLAKLKILQAAVKVYFKWIVWSNLRREIIIYVLCIERWHFAGAGQETGAALYIPQRDDQSRR